MVRLIARFFTERFLIRHSLWDECSGDPMNLWAEEFQRRDDRARAQLEGKA